jgi:hypothetical protein
MTFRQGLMEAQAMIDNQPVVISSYIRSLDRRIMVQIEPGCFVALRTARRLRLVAKRRRR